MEADINTTTAAFVFGAITSLHCVFMCGPLIASVLPLGNKQRHFWLSGFLYQTSRIVSYTLTGALLGLFGGLFENLFESKLTALLPWAMVCILIFVGLGLERFFPPPKWISRIYGGLQKRIPMDQPSYRSIATGALTPLLPCGPLYMILGISLLNGSASQGAAFLFAFALGTLPMLALLHIPISCLNFNKLRPHLPRIRKGTALVAALVLIMRLSSDMEIHPTDPKASDSANPSHTLLSQHHH